MLNQPWCNWYLHHGFFWFFRLSSQLEIFVVENYWKQRRNITCIVLEQRGVTADTALRLSRFFGGDAQSWLNLQTAYDLRVAELDEALQTAVMAVHPMALQPA